MARRVALPLVGPRRPPPFGQVGGRAKAFSKDCAVKRSRHVVPYEGARTQTLISAPKLTWSLLRQILGRCQSKQLKRDVLSVGMQI